MSSLPALLMDYNSKLTGYRVQSNHRSYKDVASQQSGASIVVPQFAYLDELENHSSNRTKTTIRGWRYNVYPCRFGSACGLAVARS